MSTFRKPSAAGYFYPSSPEVLKHQLKRILSHTPQAEGDKRIFGIVAPHAGYLYSGTTAAYAYSRLKDKDISTVVIISPSHSEYFPGVSVYNGSGYETPLGTIPVNKTKADKLVKDSRIIFYGPEGHRKEHAVEVQLPFLQSILQDFSIVPVVMGDQSKVYIDELSAALNNIIDDNTVIIASSDLSHFHTKQKAYSLDSVAAEDIRNMDYKKLEEDIKSRRCEACGAGPVAVLLKTAAARGYKSEVLHRSDSGDTTGDNREVVGYLSAVIYGE